MQFIKTLFVALIPLFISIYLNRKYQLADKDRTIVEKQFEIYNLLYLNIARDTLNQPINGNLAKTNIIKLIKEINENNILYPQTTKLLISYACYILFIVSCYIFWILLNNWIFIKKYVEWVKTYAKNKTEK